jgi:NhaC family Na+:H+ antiporter
MESALVLGMLAVAGVAGTVAARGGATWADLEDATGRQLARVLPALLVLLAIGLLIGTWMLAGTIPFLVALGVRLVDPAWLALTAFLASALMSTVTGTSWGSAGTIGVAMMGTAAALGVPLPVVAGAVISGAYFGDKMSPLSDTTIVAAVAAETDVHAHIRAMTHTAVPSFLMAGLVFAWLGGGDTAVTADAARAFADELGRAFRLHPVVLLPPLVVLVAVMRRVPSAIAIAASSLVAMALAVLLQGATPSQIAEAGVAGVTFELVQALDHARTGGDGLLHARGEASAALTRLVERGGMRSMTPTLLIVFAAFLMTGALQVAGALDALLARLLALARHAFGLVAVTMAAGLVVVGLTSHASVTMLLVGGLVRDAYLARALPATLLSRSLEDSVTITEVLLPWTVSAVFMAGTLGVPTLAYAPYAVFCWAGPLLSLGMAALGWWPSAATRSHAAT